MVRGASSNEPIDIKEHAVRLEEHLKVLARATTTFAQTSVDEQRLCERIARLVAEALNDLCSVHLLEDDGVTLTSQGFFSPDSEALEDTYSVHAHPLARRVFETGQPFHAANMHIEHPRLPGGVHSMLIVPLRVDDKPIGHITLARSRVDRPPFDEHDLDLALSLAGHASLAVSNARLLTEARREGVQHKRIEERLGLLAQASADFTSATHDLDRLLDVIARRLGALFGDLCFIRHVSDDGKWLEGPGAVFYRDEGFQAAARAMVKDERTPINEGPSGEAARTGKAILTPAAAFAAERNEAPLFNRLQVTSIMTVPLVCRGEVTGVANLLRTTEGRPYGPEDLRLVQSLADAAGLALGNARAYVAERAARAAAEAATRALQTSEARFGHIVESGLVGVLVATLDGKVIQVNDTLLKMIGYSHREIISGEVPWASLTAPEWKSVDTNAIEQLLRTGIGELREKEYVRKDGSRVPVMVGSAMVVRDTQECISFVLDLTERKHAQSLIETMRKEHAADLKFRNLLESAPDAMIIAAESGRISVVNDRVEKLFGYSRSDLLGKPIEQLIQASLDDLMHQAVGAGSELVGRRKDGSSFPIEVSVSPLQTEGGRLVSSSIRDITERKRAEQQRANLASIVDSSDDAIIGTDREGIITSWNQGAERLFGYAANEMIGEPVLKLAPEGVDTSEIIRTLTTGEVQRFDTVRRRRDGSLVHVSMTTSPVMSQGRLVGVSKVARDATERIKSDEALTRAKDAAEAASRELEAFSYSVAHDLRTPLRGMNGFAQVLLDEYAGKLDHEGNLWLREIVKNAQRMGALIDALLSLSRVSRSELRREHVNLSLIAADITKSLADSQPLREVDIVIAPGLFADLDPSLARSLLDNLFANAWKFTAKSAHPRIELGQALVEGGELAFFIKDNGAGFSMEYADKLFVAFQRLHTVSEYPGTGIGLATVHRIVRRHGGRIWAEGTVGEGATFYFAVPAAVLQPTNATNT